MQLTERYAWIPSIGAEYFVGVDGLSLLLVALTTIIFPFAFLAGRMSRGAHALLLVMQAALYGTFTAQNFVLWFLFYEMSLVRGFLLFLFRASDLSFAGPARTARTWPPTDCVHRSW